MAAPTKIHMPERYNGKPVPNPVRWMCDQGHIHPSRPRAVKCNQKYRAQAAHENRPDPSEAGHDFGRNAR